MLKHLVALLAVVAMTPTLVADWPNATGDGTFNPSEKTPAFTKPPALKIAWLNPTLTGVQKSNLRHEGAFFGGCAGLVVSDGVVFTNFYRPSGDVLNEKTQSRYYPNPGELTRTLRQIDADDVTVALDAETGKTLWTAEEKGRSMNFLPAKRGAFGFTPAVANGRLHTVGALGILYTYDAKTGKKLWEARLEPFATRAEAIKKKALDDKAIIDSNAGMAPWGSSNTSLMTVNDLVVGPDGARGLVAFKQATGEKAWETPRETIKDRKGAESLKVAPIIAETATPVVWTHAGKSYLLCAFGWNNGGKITCLDAATGKIAWTLSNVGPSCSTVVHSGDVMLVNSKGDYRPGGQRSREPDAPFGLWSAYRIRPDGPEKLWTMENIPENYASIAGDSGQWRKAVIKDGVAYMLLGDVWKYQLSAVDMASGKVLARTPLVQVVEGDAATNPTQSCQPYVIGNRVFVHKNLAHAGFDEGFWVVQIDGREQLKSLGLIDFRSQKIQAMNGYEALAETPFSDGKFYTKTQDGIMALDIRE